MAALLRLFAAGDAGRSQRTSRAGPSGAVSGLPEHRGDATYLERYAQMFGIPPFNQTFLMGALICFVAAAAALFTPGRYPPQTP
jgi:hypothetical protein